MPISEQESGSFRRQTDAFTVANLRHIDPITPNILPTCMGYTVILRGETSVQDVFVPKAGT